MRFARGDLGKWTSRGDHDLVLANASLQWVPDHPGCSPDGGGAGARRSTRRAGAANADHVRIRLANRVAATEPFLSAFNSLPPPDPVGQNVLAPEHYSIILDDLGAPSNTSACRSTPIIESTASVVEWTRGTTLTRFTKLLEPDLAGQFIDAFRARASTLGDVCRTSTRSSAS